MIERRIGTSACFPHAGALHTGSTYQVPDKDNMKPIFKKVLSFLTIICCVAGSLGTVHASESESVPRVVFVNEQKDLPDLYISKTVECPEGYSAPADAAFQFLLELDGKPAERRDYVLCSLDGTELTKEEVYNWTGQEVEQNLFRTSSGGTFSLRAGLTAKFTGVGVGVNYVVQEILDPQEPYEQILPAGGVPAQGVMQKQGAQVRFTNRYLPKIEGAPVKLEVQKTIAFPEGLDAPETPAFTFQLTVNSAPYAQKSYTLRDDQSGALLPGGTTDDDGIFALKGGQTAVFEGEDLQAGLEYEVTELNLPDGWHAVGETSKKGALTAPLTLAGFHNSEVSFAVTKHMEDNTRPDKAFTFQLARDDGSLWADAEYYRYDWQGNLVPASDSDETAPSDTDGTSADGSSDGTAASAPTDALSGGTSEPESALPGTDGSSPDAQSAEVSADGTSDETAEPASFAAGKHRTGADGTFTLNPGETAVFTGLAPGTGYTVSEQGDPDYIQVQPLDVEGYTGRTVQESPVETLPFVNRKAPEVPTLAVTKVVENLKGDAADPGDEFHFILRKKEGNEWKTMNSAFYTVTVGSSESTGSTGPDGEFTLRANETARFTRLQPGEYQVEEIGLNSLPGYQFKSVTVIGPDTASAEQSRSASGGSTEGTAVPSETAFGEIPAAQSGADRSNTDDDDYDITDSDSSGAGTIIPPAKPKAQEEGTLGTSGTTGFVFTNTYCPDKLDLAVVKQSPFEVTLEGAVFRLWKLKEDATAPSEDDFDQIKSQLDDLGTLTTDADGHLTFEALSAGTYYLQETIAPPGYRVLEQPVKITVTRDAANEPTVTVAALSAEDNITSTFVNEPGTRDRIELAVTDQYVYELPSAGGPGIYLYMISGVLLMVAAVLFLRYHRLQRS